MSEHVRDVGITMAFETAVVECRQECQDRIDRTLMPLMQSLKCRRLLIELIILPFDLAYDGRDDSLLTLQRHELLSQACQLRFGNGGKILASSTSDFTTRGFLAIRWRRITLAFVITVGLSPCLAIISLPL